MIAIKYACYMVIFVWPVYFTKFIEDISQLFVQTSKPFYNYDNTKTNKINENLNIKNTKEITLQLNTKEK